MPSPRTNRSGRVPASRLPACIPRSRSTSPTASASDATAGRVASRPATKAGTRLHEPPTGALASAGQAGSRFRKLADERVFERVVPDIHQERGLDCIDCHTPNEVMGDGAAHARKRDQLRVACEDCHPRPGVVPSTVALSALDPESRKSSRSGSGRCRLPGLSSGRRQAKRWSTSSWRPAAGRVSCGSARVNAESGSRRRRYASRARVTRGCPAAAVTRRGRRGARRATRRSTRGPGRTTGWPTKTCAGLGRNDPDLSPPSLRRLGFDAGPRLGSRRKSSTRSCPG